MAKTIERQGNKAEPYVRHYPQVISGICEFCGVLDNTKPSTEQYKLCQHYSGMELRCSYCDESKNPEDVIYHANLNITDHPTSGQLVVCCDSYTCTQKHQKRFQQ